MNWILILILWGPHGQTTTQTQFQTKFLCEKAGEDIVKAVNESPAEKIPLSGYWACEQVHKVAKPPEPEMSASQKNHTHKFEVGQCVSMYGHDPFKIYEIMQDEQLNDYGVVLDATCKEKPQDRVLCPGSGSAYNIDYVDKEGKLVDCP
jgi:hypothetical protein